MTSFKDAVVAVLLGIMQAIVMFFVGVCAALLLALDLFMWALPCLILTVMMLGLYFMVTR